MIVTFVSIIIIIGFKVIFLIIMKIISLIKIISAA